MEKGPGKNERNRVWLSVVVIGRNEGKRLPALFESLPRGAGIEWIYVDSCSADNSVETALRAGAKVYRVEENSVFGPGTGRYIGTKEAAGTWVLYLDGDMVLRKEFLPLLERIGRGDQLPPGTAAIVGRTRHRYLDEKGNQVSARDYAVLPPKAMGPVEEWGRAASYHGGAVLYRKDFVLVAGNWNPAVYQLEEVDLCCRVRAQGGMLRAVDLPMADHYTAHLNTMERIKRNFLPRYRGKHLYGAGQVVAARLKEGSLGSFIRCYPYPFVLLGGLLLVPPLFFIWPPLPLLANLAVMVWIGTTQRWYYYLVYLGNLLQIGRGLGRYRPFEPQYRRVSNRD